MDIKQVANAMQEIEFVLHRIKSDSHLHAGEVEKAHEKAQQIMKQYLQPLGAFEEAAAHVQSDHADSPTWLPEEDEETPTKDMFKLKCRLCQHEFPYDRNEHYHGPTRPYPDDWDIDCPRCENWEQVGNNNPDTFEILQRGEDFVPELELTDEQLKRNDEVDNAVFECLKVLLENPALEWDNQIIEEATDAIKDAMMYRKVNVRLPRIHTDDDTGKQVYTE